MRSAPFIVCLAACGPGATRPTSFDTHAFVDARSGAAFEAPADWQAEDLGTATVLAGPKGSDAYYTTLTLQARDGQITSLEEILATAYTDNQNLEDVTFFATGPTFVADELGLAYFVRFVVYEQARLRAGVLFAQNHGIFDLTYTAPETLFSLSVPVFEHALATLTLDGGSEGEL